MRTRPRSVEHLRETVERRRLLRDTLTIEDRLVRFHSFRPTMITRLAVFDMRETHDWGSAGHKRAKGEYGNFMGGIPLAVLHEAINKAPFPSGGVQGSGVGGEAALLSGRPNASLRATPHRRA